MQPPGCAPMGGHSTPNPAAVYLEAVTQTHTHIHASLQCVRGAQRPHLCPLTKASPPVVLSSPVSILKVLVFPAPLTPRSPKHSPGRTPRHRRSTARIRPIFRDLYTWPKSLTPQQRTGLLPGPGPAPFPIYFPTARAYLGQVLNLDHVIVSIPTEHSLPLTGHIHVILHRFSRHRQASRAVQWAGPGQSTHPYQGSLPSPNTPHSLWLPQEVILAHDREEESHEALNCHGHQSTRDNVPLKWGLHLVKLACGTGWFRA